MLIVEDPTVNIQCRTAMQPSCPYFVSKCNVG